MSPESANSVGILIVDDDPQLRSAVSRVLRDAGYRVMQARNASDALSQIKSKTVDLLLTDVIMPRSSGIELAQMASAISPRTQVLYMSGHPEDPHIRALMGNANFLEKPFNPDELIQAVRRVLASPLPSRVAS
jgi:DNA-binding NtrC family response regulator